MKKQALLRAGRLWLEGLALFALRLVQLRTGFDPVTGLSLPSLAGNCLWIGLLACLALEALLCLRRPRGRKRSWACCFDAPEGPAVGGLAAGSFLLIAGGGLLLASALPPQGTAAVTAAAAGALGIAGGAGLLLLARGLRRGEASSVFPLLPVMFFSVLFLMSIYFPEEGNPVLQRYFLPVLASAMAAYFFYQLAGFFQREGNLRWFSFTGGAAAVTCLAAAADGLDNLARLPAFLGCAVIATVFLLLPREEPLPEPEPEKTPE